MVQTPYVHSGDGNPNPRIFQLGLVGGLAVTVRRRPVQQHRREGCDGRLGADGCLYPANTTYAHSIVAIG
jgi:hypothetical protein